MGSEDTGRTRLPFTLGNFFEPFELIKPACSFKGGKIESATLFFAFEANSAYRTTCTTRITLTLHLFSPFFLLHPFDRAYSYDSTFKLVSPSLPPSLPLSLSLSHSASPVSHSQCLFVPCSRIGRAYLSSRCCVGRNSTYRRSVWKKRKTTREEAREKKRVKDKEKRKERTKEKLVEGPGRVSTSKNVVSRLIHLEKTLLFHASNRREKKMRMK